MFNSFFRYGRINRATYWLILAIGAAVYAAIVFYSSKPAAIREFVLAIVAIPRLHDMGKSAWWVAGVFVAELAIIAGAFLALPMDSALLVSFGFELILVALMIWIGVIPGDPNANRFGDAPASGISFRKKAASS